MSCKNINETSVDCHSAIVFGSLKREKREVEYFYFGGERQAEGE
jgi:hypothetical protein